VPVVPNRTSPAADAEPNAPAASTPHAASKAPATTAAGDGRDEDPRRALGRIGEDLAAAHFTRLGYRVLARNVRTRHGEIDLIAFDGRTLAVAEVKTRRVPDSARPLRPEQQPLAGLRWSQSRRLRRLAVAWLSDEDNDRPTARTIRFDAVGVLVDRSNRLLRLDHIEAAW
jgi:putative endonuclease